MLQPISMEGRSNLTHKWEPLVHGRTYQVDYRSNLLAVPAWFEAGDISWVMPFILGTFDSFLVRGLAEPVHWSVFKNQRYCVVGLTCLAHQVSEDMNQDMGNRVLPVFLGYISRNIAEPVLPRMEIGEKGNAETKGGQFSELYHYVRQRWYEKRQDRESKVEDTPENTFDLEIADYPLDEDVRLNVEGNRIKIWPVPQKNGKDWLLARDEALWAAVSHHQGPVSLCLGLSRQGTAINGPFLNASAYDVQEIVRVYKPVKEPPIARPSAGNFDRTQQPGMEQHRDQSRQRPNEYRQGVPNETGGILGNIIERPLTAAGYVQESIKEEGVAGMLKGIGKGLKGFGKFLMGEDDPQEAFDQEQPYQRGPAPQVPHPSAPKGRGQGPGNRYDWVPPAQQKYQGPYYQGDARQRSQFPATSGESQRPIPPSQPRDMQPLPPSEPPERDWFGEFSNKPADIDKDTPAIEKVDKTEAAPERDGSGTSTGPLRNEASEDDLSEQPTEELKEDSSEKQADT